MLPMLLAPRGFPLFQLIHAHSDGGDFGLGDWELRDGVPSVASRVVVRLKWPVRSGRAGHDGDGTGEGTVECPGEELAAVRRGSDPLLCGEERFVGWIRRVGLSWRSWSSHSGNIVSSVDIVSVVETLRKKDRTQLPLVE